MSEITVTVFIGLNLLLGHRAIDTKDPTHWVRTGIQFDRHIQRENESHSSGRKRKVKYKKTEDLFFNPWAVAIAQPFGPIGDVMVRKGTYCFSAEREREKNFSPVMQSTHTRLPFLSAVFQCLYPIWLLFLNTHTIPIARNVFKHFQI